MHDFFNVNLFQQIASGLVVLFVSILLGSRKTKGATNGKGWKVSMILAWFMILGGLYMIGQNVQNGGIYNPYVGMGICSFVFGLILKYISRFFLWWHN